jgi:hypothetical protein
MFKTVVEEIGNFLKTDKEENILLGLEALAQNVQLMTLFKEYLLAQTLAFKKHNLIYIQSESLLGLIFSQEFISKLRKDNLDFYTTNIPLVVSYLQLPNLDKSLFLNLLILYTKNDSDLIFMALKKGFKLEKFSVKNVKKISFKNIHKEKYLMLGNPDLSVFENLEYLDLSYNQLTHIPLSVSSLVNLKTLIISHNQINEIPDDFFEKLDKLEKIEAQRNLINHIPASLARCKSLISLQLQNNQINLFPQFLCELTNLEDINLCNNFICQIPSQINNLKQLTKLYLADNLIINLPSSQQALSRLRQLSLIQNYIDIPDFIYQMPNLDILSLFSLSQDYYYEYIHLIDLDSDFNEYENIDIGYEHNYYYADKLIEQGCLVYEKELVDSTLLNLYFWDNYDFDIFDENDDEMIDVLFQQIPSLKKYQRIFIDEGLKFKILMLDAEYFY